jgi:hypothetical protein
MYMTRQEDRREDQRVLPYCDSQSYKAITKNPKFCGRTKHIKCRCHFIRSKVKANEVEFVNLGTNQMVENTFNKSIPKAKFEYCKSRLGVLPIKSLKRKLEDLE